MKSKSIFYEELIDSNQLTQIALQRYPIDNSSIPNEFFRKDSKLFLETIVDIFVCIDYFPKEELQNFSVDLILDYLERTHKHYLNKSLPEIEQTIHNLKQNYSQTHPCLLLLELFFKDYRNHLAEHINYEENTFFPYIKYLLKAKELQNTNIKIGHYSLNDFCKEHTDNEIGLRNVRQAIYKYEPTATKQSPYRILLTQLKVFEMDLHLHARIEEEILLPKVIELENQIKSKFITTVLKN
jgi:regulator of cell morphogenesis and NO signaling